MLADIPYTNSFKDETLHKNYFLKEITFLIQIYFCLEYIVNVCKYKNSQYIDLYLFSNL